MNRIGIIFRKELIDVLRDRRTLTVVLLSSLSTGPLILLMLSTMIGRLEKKAEAREVYVAGIEHAPSLKNYFERQTYRVTEAPVDFERRLRSQDFTDPVFIVPPGFETQLASGDVPTLQLMTSSDNQQAEGSVARLSRLVQGFVQEQVMYRLQARGIAPGALEVLRLDEHDVATAAARGAMLAMMLPFLVLMTVLTGAMTAAIDTTAGERERGSLEPLLVNPARPVEIVVGKWLAVATVGIGGAILSAFSFLPAQVLIRSERVSASFHFGLPEVVGFIEVLTPFAAFSAALFMVLSIRSKTVKEAQATGSIVMLALSMPSMLLNMLDQGDSKTWQLAMPGAGQGQVMLHILKGEALTPLDILVPLAVAVAVAVVCLALMTNRLRSAAIR